MKLTQVIVVSFMRASHGKAETCCQFVAQHNDEGKASIVEQINRYFDSVSPYSDEELEEMEIERLTDFSKLVSYVGEHADYFDVDISEPHDLYVR